MQDLPFALTVAAPAKLNLGLEVLGRRADGYHDLATIFLTVSLFDELSVASTPGPRLGLECTGSDLPPQENLVWRAAEAMQQVAPDRGSLLRLQKRIPIAAGLGGASSDAAATLLALRTLWQLALPDDALAAMALELGSDVPFLLRGGCALGGGRGEVLEGLPVPGAPSPEKPSPPAPRPVRGRGEHDSAPEADEANTSLTKGVSRLPQSVASAGENPFPSHGERGWGEGSSGREAGGKDQSNGNGLTFLIVAPRLQIPSKTASLFAALEPGDFSDGTRVRQQAERLRAGRTLEPALLGNAFSRALYALRPDVAAMAGAMREAGAEHVALSGAGPAHYAVFTDPATAFLVKRRLEKRLRDAADIYLAVPVPAREAGSPAATASRP